MQQQEVRPEECYCYASIHLAGRHEFKVYPRTYYSGKIIVCPKCGGDSHITRKAHENTFTLESARSARGEVDE